VQLYRIWGTYHRTYHHRSEYKTNAHTPGTCTLLCQILNFRSLDSLSFAMLQWPKALLRLKNNCGLWRTHISLATGFFEGAAAEAVSDSLLPRIRAIQAEYIDGNTDGF
jgi:hypothetical protein